MGMTRHVNGFGRIPVGPYLTPKNEELPAHKPAMANCANCGKECERWGRETRHVDHYNTMTGKLKRVDVYCCDECRALHVEQS